MVYRNGVLIKAMHYVLTLLHYFFAVKKNIPEQTNKKEAIITIIQCLLLFKSAYVPSGPSGQSLSWFL